MRLNSTLVIVCLILIGFQTRAQSCGTTIEKGQIEEINKVIDTYRISSRTAIQSNPTVKYIEVKPHVVRKSDGSGGIVKSQIDSVFRILNIRFAPLNIQFLNLEANFIDSDTYFEFDDSDETALAGTNDLNDIINVYYVNTITREGTSFNGYAYFPGSFDRVFMTFDATLNSISTLSHEFGHYFNLYHTHGKTNFGTTDELVDGSNCSSAGDDICDTAADPNQTDLVDYYCTYMGNATDANGDLYDPDPSNIMAYGRSKCRDHFTEGQYTRMENAKNATRNYLNGFEETSFASFVASEVLVENGGSVQFTDQSLDAVDWNWSFQGGTPSSSTDQNPLVTYSELGQHNVSLEITDSNGDIKSFEFPQYITVGSGVDITFNTPEGWDGPARFYKLDADGTTKIYQTVFDAGDNIFMDYGVINQGIKDALDSTFRVNIYLNDELVRWNTFTLSAGNTSIREERDLALPPPGTNEIRIEYDVEDDYPEINEDNNTYITTLEVSEPDVGLVGTVSPIAGIEFFIDEVVGFGDGTFVATSSGNDVTMELTIPIDGLPSGLHKLYTRALNQAGRWGQTTKRNFYVVPTQDLSQKESEYFFDSDPGYGLATPIVLTDGESNHSIDLSGLSNGYHRLYVRSQNHMGRWSSTQSISFMKVGQKLNPKISKLVYRYYDYSSETYGEFIEHPFSPVVEQSEEVLYLDNGSLTVGTQYAIVVYAQDENGYRSKIAVDYFIYKINTSPTILNQTFTIDESAVNATVIGQVEASDADGDELTYAILSGNINDAFALSASGELSVATSTELDFETAPSFSLEVEVNDGNGGTAQATITINLNDLDENTAPTISNQTFTIDENAVNATVIGQVEASDADGDELMYSILSGNTNDAFALSTTGELSVATSTELDFETTPSFSLEVEVNDGNGGTAQATITINLNDLDENTDPTIADQTFTIDENAVNATVIGQVEASDADGDELTYSILSGNTNDAFALSVNGELSVATSTELDFETAPSFSLEVEVNDGNGGTAQATITINLNDIDENTDPTIADQTFTIDENAVNATVIGQVEASDADGDELTYSILSGNTNNAFALSARGELSVKTSAALDFETTPSFSLEVEVNDGNGGTAQATITINLNDIDENTDPTIADQTFTIDENAVNATVIGQVEASDADGDELTYSILSGNTNNAFALSTTGELSVQNSSELDFETTPSFSLQVEVNDGNGGTAQATITINLNDVDENTAPTISNQTFTIDENAVNATIIGQVEASDADGDNLTFSIISGNTNDAFALSASGELSVATSTELDFETTSSFSLEVEVNDGNGGTAQATITINLNDVDENTDPTISNQTFTIDENAVNATVIGQLEASDADGDELTYSILSGNTNDAFALSARGELSVATSTELDFETTPSFSLEVEVNDGNEGTAQATITINLNDVDENTDPTISNQTLTVDENAVNATVIGQVEASDADGDVLTYSILSGNTNDAFALSASGELSVATSTELDFETTPSFSLEVEVNDGNGGDAQAIISIDLENVDETRLLPNTYTLSESSPSGTRIGGVGIFEENTDLFPFFETDQIDQTDEALLKGVELINAGALEFSSENFDLILSADEALDYESFETFEVIVKLCCFTMGEEPNATITVNVTNVNEATSMEDQTFSVDENSVFGTTIGQLEAYDEDGDDLHFSILSGNTNDVFALSIDGKITVQNELSLDYETIPSFELEVEVIDGNGGADTAIITIDLVNLEEKGPLGVYSKMGLSFFPNPTNGIVRIKTSQFLNETGILFDFSGKKILEVQLNQGDTTMDFHLLPAGIYFFKLGDQAVKITKIE